MNEETGLIKFYNVYDYTSDVDNKRYAGCLISLRGANRDIPLFVDSERLQAGALAAYGKGSKVTVFFSDILTPNFQHIRSQAEINDWLRLYGFKDGPFILKAIWTRDNGHA